MCMGCAGVREQRVSEHSYVLTLALACQDIVLLQVLPLLHLVHACMCCKCGPYCVCASLVLCMPLYCIILDEVVLMILSSLCLLARQQPIPATMLLLILICLIPRTCMCMATASTQWPALMNQADFKQLIPAAVHLPLLITHL